MSIKERAEPDQTRPSQNGPARTAAEGPRPGPLSPQLMIGLQRSAGNGATSRLMAPAAAARSVPLQRQPQLPTDTSPTARVWNMPFGFGSATVNEEAALGLEQIIDRFRNLRSFTGFPEVQAACDSVIRSLSPEVAKVRGSGPDQPISDHDLTDLMVMGSLAEASYKEQGEKIANKVLEAIEPIKAKSTEGDEDQMAEELHDRFRVGDAEGVESVKEALEGIKQYSEKATKVVQWANRVRGVVQLFSGGESEEAWKAPEEIGELLQGKNSLAEGLEHVNQVLGAARVIADISAIGQERAGSIDRTVDEFGTAMDAISVGMSFVKAVPLLGDLWSKYYMPMTDACLKGIKVLARYADEENRQLAWADWQLAPSKGEVPKIPKENLGNFLGGQPVFDYMYRLVNDMKPKMTDDVEDFFVANRELLQAGEKDEIETEGGSHWYDPTSWGDRETSPNLAGWLSTHRDNVWSELYGSLPHRW